MIFMKLSHQHTFYLILANVTLTLQIVPTQVKVRSEISEMILILLKCLKGLCDHVMLRLKNQAIVGHIRL